MRGLLMNKQSSYPGFVEASPRLRQTSRHVILMITRFLVRWHWAVLATIAGITLVLETLEHISRQMDSHWFFYSEVILITLLLVTAGLLMRQTLDSLTERSRLIDLLHKKNEISIQLAEAVDESEVAEDIIHFVSASVPSATASLYTLSENLSSLKLITPGITGESAPNTVQQPLYMPSPCLHCIENRGNLLHPLMACNTSTALLEKSHTTRLCLPLLYGKQTAGMLLIQLPEGQALASEQAEVLEVISSEVARALIATGEKKTRTEMAVSQATRAIQMDIARDLHDTIGQNIGYLRMKLEHMSESNIIKEAGPKAEISQMSAVAEESYDLVRGTLAMLQAGDTGSLENILNSHACMIAERSGLDIEFNTHGKSEALPPKIFRQMFYIFREALSNVEKHAQAAHVSVDIEWAPAKLSMTLRDDGRGFDPSLVKVNTHYGLKFMQSRADSLKGQFALNSSPGSGTSISVTIPLDPTTWMKLS